MLERVNGELADLLTGRSGGGRIFQDLEQANAFVVPLDAQRSWFRYHRLFGDLLQFELMCGNLAGGQAKARPMRWLFFATDPGRARSARIERDLHDGTQQRLVSLALKLRAAQAAVAPELGGQLDEAVAEATGALEELSKIARGIHPAILAKAVSTRPQDARPPLANPRRPAGTHRRAAARPGRGQRLLRRR